MDKRLQEILKEVQTSEKLDLGKNNKTQKLYDKLDKYLHNNAKLFEDKYFKLNKTYYHLDSHLRDTTFYLTYVYSGDSSVHFIQLVEYNFEIWDLLGWQEITKKEFETYWQEMVYSVNLEWTE